VADKGLSQEEVNRIATREKEQGRAAALAQVQADLGVPLEEAKALIEAAKAASEMQKTEAQKARDAADREKAAAEAEKSTTAKERHEGRIERALFGAGIHGDDEAADTKRARIARLVEAKVGDDLDTIKAAVAALKKDMPELFGTPAPKTPAAPGGDPKGGPPAPKQAEDAFTRGMARAQGARAAFTAQVDRKPA